MGEDTQTAEVCCFSMNPAIRYSNKVFQGSERHTRRRITPTAIVHAAIEATPPAPVNPVLAAPAVSQPPVNTAPRPADDAIMNSWLEHCRKVLLGSDGAAKLPRNTMVLEISGRSSSEVGRHLYLELWERQTKTPTTRTSNEGVNSNNELTGIWESNAFAAAFGSFLPRHISSMSPYSM